MKPEEFIRFAEAISTDSSIAPASCRSAVSRAYYGGFHLVREELVRPLGFRVLRGGNEHIWLQRVLLGSNVVEAQQIATTLRSLSDYRKQADYDLRKEECEQHSHVLKCLKLAQDIEAFTRTALETKTLAQIKSGITAYLKKINEL